MNKQTYELTTVGTREWTRALEQMSGQLLNMLHINSSRYLTRWCHQQ